MRIALAFLAVALTIGESVHAQQGQEPVIPPPNPNVASQKSSPPASATGPMIRYEVRWITLQSPEWRGKFDNQLQPLSRQAGTTVWTVDQATLKAMLTDFQGDSRINVLQAPSVVTPIDQTARVVNEEDVHYVARLKSVVANPTPGGPAPKPAFQPEEATVQDGIRLLISSARRVPEQGLSVHVSLEDTRVFGFHSAKVAHASSGKSGESRFGKLFHKSGADTGHAELHGMIQVPEVAWSQIQGDWLIPKEGALLLSAGPRSLPGKHGKESYSERVVVIGYVDSPQTVAASPAPATAAR